MGRQRGILFVATAAAVSPAYAQRTDNNAVTASDDAFGRSVGDETIGIYNEHDVRGFSPVDAGNVRIDGLYIDQIEGLSARLQAGSSIRVGISAQGYAFPSPTGIVDNQLVRPGDKLLASVAVKYGPWRGSNVELDLQMPIDGERLGIAAGVDFTTDGTSFGALNKSRSVAVTARYAPSDSFSIQPFWSRNRDISRPSQPVIDTGGAFLPKRVPRNVFKGQDWASYAGSQDSYGVIARAKLSGFDVRLGAFHQSYLDDRTAFDLLRNTNADGTVGRVDLSGVFRGRLIVLGGGDNAASTSGELRVSRTFREGKREHELIASVRMRAQDRNYGGEAVYRFSDLSFSDRPDPRPLPTFAIGPKTHDRIRQQTFGLAYRGKWLGVGELTLGVQKAYYRKLVTDPLATVQAPETRDNPWLGSATAAVYVTPRIALYAGYTRGLEESDLAPQDAANFPLAPPAIKTQQVEAGARWTISNGVNLIAGVFSLSKPNYNVDAVNIFRQLGTERRRGIEVSLAGSVAKNLYAVAGQVFLDPTVSGDDVTSGKIGRRPVGAILSRTQVSLNYRLPWVKGLSLDWSLQASGNRIANLKNTLIVPPRAVFGVGARYRFEVSNKQFLLRAQVSNIANTFGWDVSRSGRFTHNGSRRFALTLSADI